MSSLLRRTHPMALAIGIYAALIAFAIFAFRNVM
jgi:hypothetical protein